MSATPNERLRMLWHLGTVRAARGDRSFGALVEARCATVTYPPDAPDKVHYHLTPRGRDMAVSQSRLGR